MRLYVMKGSIEVVIQLYEELINRYLYEFPDYEYFLAPLKNQVIDFFREYGSLPNILNINLPVELIQNVFDKTGILILREPMHEKLLVGCGNTPRIQLYNYQTGEGEHNHEDSDTLNIDLRLNPTVVTLFGPDNNRLAEAFEYFRQHRYQTLAFEAMTPFAQNSDAMRTFNFSFMADDFNVVEQRGYRETPTRLETQTVSFLAETSKYFDALERIEHNLSEYFENQKAKRINAIKNTYTSTLFTNHEKMNRKIKKIIANDDLTSFIKYFPETGKINDTRIDNDIPLVFFTFDSKAWKIFQYLILNKVNLDIDHKGITIQAKIRKMILDDDVYAFKSIFKNNVLLHKIYMRDLPLYEYIHLYSRKNIHDYVVNNLKAGVLVMR